MLLSFLLCNFLVRMLKYFLKNSKTFFCPQKVEKTTSKSCILMAVVRFFVPAAPTAQNSPDLHFCFINSFIQLSLLRSLPSNKNIIAKEDHRTKRIKNEFISVISCLNYLGNNHRRIANLFLFEVQ